MSYQRDDWPTGCECLGQCKCHAGDEPCGYCAWLEGWALGYGEAERVWRPA
jgi:hypothetical protein